MKPERTRKKTLSSYETLYGGDDFMIYYQYAHMIVLTWVTFLFAPCMPILFPIGLFGLVMLYYSNRFALAYQCVRPKDYN